MKTMHVVISGLVQGVGFRFFAARQARMLGVHGFVRNLPAGEVEVLAQGETGLLERFLHDLRVGPRSAQVTATRLVWKDTTEQYHDFTIR
ncbi:MAG: acylphosphatase [Bacteroidota bacterium]|jgi:acylphosphatase|nr:acylphosphatase [Bacteroidota bacterium]